MSVKSFLTVLLEACIVGILLIPFTYIAGYLVTIFMKKPSLPEICSTWNKYYIMEINLFVAGFLFHLVSEYSGLNKLYVDNYYVK